MIISLIGALLTYILFSVCCAWWAGEPTDRRFLVRIVLLGWALLTPLTMLVDYLIPFAGGGDDEGYFELARLSVSSWSQLLDPLRFQGDVEQAGFPWILSLINLLFEPELIGYKLFNILVLILIGLTWYRIGLHLEGRRFGRLLAAAMLMLTPLWYYTFFLLKDLSIVFLQSVLILGLVRTWGGAPTAAWLTAGTATLVTIPFRSPLVVQNLAVAIASAAVRMYGPGKPWRRIAVVLVGVPTTVGLLLLASDPIAMESFGIYTENRVLGSDAMWRTGEEYGVESRRNVALFPAVYLLSEIAILNPELWSDLDGFWVRGLLAVPWIIFVAPLFMVGLRWLAFRPPGIAQERSVLGRVAEMRVVSTPWSVIAVFILSSMGVSWIVGDTTRWRLADMPAILAVALAAWHYGSRKTNITVLTLWMMLTAVAFSLYYLLR